MTFIYSQNVFTESLIPNLTNTSEFPSNLSVLKNHEIPVLLTPDN